MRCALGILGIRMISEMLGEKHGERDSAVWDWNCRPIMEGEVRRQLASLFGDN